MLNNRLADYGMELPSGFSFPKSFELALSTVSRDEIFPWWFVASEPEKAKLFFDIINIDMKSSKLLVPFAKIDDESGDVACFDGDDLGGNPRVYFSTGPEQTHEGVDWESRYYLKDFDAWLEKAREGQ